MSSGRCTVRLLLLLCPLVGCEDPAAPAARPNATRPRHEAVSLLGVPLYAMSAGPKTADMEARLAAARAGLAADPDDPAKIVWVGRRLAYLGRLQEAIEVYTAGIAAHPDYAPLYRHRGHRYITARRFGKAIADLERAARLINGRPDEVEPDGMPNAKNVPLTTTGFNVWYHLALARYLTADFTGALHAWQRTLEYTRGYDDNVVAVTDWLYMTLRRLGREREAAAVLAPIRPEMDIIENAAYHRRCLMYKGLIAPDELMAIEGASDIDAATLGYGLGNWHLYHGRTPEAIEVFERVVAGPNWMAFGYIAAEADLARLRRN